jgi:hypothetical protein
LRASTTRKQKGKLGEKGIGGDSHRGRGRGRCGREDTKGLSKEEGLRGQSQGPSSRARGSARWHRAKNIARRTVIYKKRGEKENTKQVGEQCDRDPGHERKERPIASWSETYFEFCTGCKAPLEALSEARAVKPDMLLVGVGHGKERRSEPTLGQGSSRDRRAESERCGLRDAVGWRESRNEARAERCCLTGTEAPVKSSGGPRDTIS